MKSKHEEFDKIPSLWNGYIWHNVYYDNIIWRVNDSYVQRFFIYEVKVAMKKIMSILILLSIALAGCGVSKDNNENDREISIYNPFARKIISYDTEEMKSDYNPFYAEGNNYQYSFPTLSKYYTTGDNFECKFEILEYKNGLFESIHKLKNQESEGLFPLAEDDMHAFFIKSYYDSNGGLKESAIVEFKNDNIKEYFNARGLITRGVIFDGLLYYVAYESSTDKFNLYSLDYEDYEGKPKLLRDDLILDQILVLNNKIYLSDRDKIYCETDSFKKKSENFYDIKSNTLIQFSTESGKLELSIIDAETKDQVELINNVDGISYEEGKLKVYGEGFIKEIDLGTLTSE